LLEIEERAKILATYIIENKSTVRQAAKKFNVSKSTVHKDISERLEKVNPSLAIEAKKILEINKMERHIRGGLATKLKYEKERKINCKIAN
jgi:putative DeoR family transcriptional regulator (stage III sporulation protein D)